MEARFLVLPPSLAFSLTLSAAALVVAAAALIQLLLSWASIRATHATLVGGVLGALVVVALCGPALVHLDSGSPFLLLACLPVLFGSSVVGVWLARARAGRPASALLTWSGAALMLAGMAQWVASAADGWSYAAIAAGLAIAVAGLRGLPVLGGGMPRAQFGAVCIGLLITTGVAAFWPWWLPWLEVDRDLPDVGSWPPNFLLVVLERPEGPVTRAAELLEVLASEAVAYERLYKQPEPLSLLTLPGGGSLAAHLQGYGYATVSVGALRGTGLEAGFAEIDDRPGGSTLLAESGAWMAGAPLLLGPLSPLMALLGHERPLRTPEALGSAAALWLLDWRFSRAPRPFLLLIDFRAPDVSHEAVGLGFASILDSLREHQLEQNTVIVIAVANASRPPAEGLQALIVPPYSWEPPITREVVTAPIWGRELSRSLVEIALSNGEQPLHFPGLARELVPPKLP